MIPEKLFAVSSDAVSSDAALSYESRALPALEQLGLNVARDHLDSVCQQAAAQNWSYSHFLGYLL